MEWASDDLNRTIDAKDIKSNIISVPLTRFGREVKFVIEQFCCGYWYFRNPRLCSSSFILFTPHGYFVDSSFSLKSIIGFSTTLYKISEKTKLIKNAITK